MLLLDMTLLNKDENSHVMRYSKASFGPGGKVIQGRDWVKKSPCGKNVA